MPAPKCDDEQFIELFRRLKSPTLVARSLGVNMQTVNGRRRRIQERYGVYLQTIALTPNAQAAAESCGATALKPHAYEPLAHETVRDGFVFVFSDAHFWPGEKSLAFEALCVIAKDLKPQLIIGNGDLFDGATISRHDVLGWQKLPTVADELHECRERLAEIKRASPKSRTRATVGNHDSRMDRRLATEIPQFQDIHGMALEDHLPDWPLSYAVMINEDTDPTFVVHNIKNGIHATWNNTASTGCHVITGHLHDQNERVRNFLNKEASGIDAGCLADTDGPQFSYRMSRPSNWRSGFVVLQYDKAGRMFPPEFCRVQKFKGYQRATFRGRTVLDRKAAA